MVTRKIQIAEVNGTCLHYREDGDPTGPALVFANSLGTDIRLWDALLPLLPSSLRIIRFDKRGHGLSDCTKPPYSMATLCEDAEQLLDQLGIKDCVFVGLSIGGMIGQSLASKRPDLIRALVLSNTAAKMGDPTSWASRIAAIEADGLESLADTVMQRWFAPTFLASPESKAWRNLFVRCPQAGYIGCCHAIANADLRARTAQLTLPTLGIAGNLDDASPPELVRDTVESIAGARFNVIENTGHLPCVEDPNTFATLLNQFLKEQHHV